MVKIHDISEETKYLLKMLSFFVENDHGSAKAIFSKGEGKGCTTLELARRRATSQDTHPGISF